MAKAKATDVVEVVMLSRWGDFPAGSIQQIPMSLAQSLADMGMVDMSESAIRSAKKQ